MGSKAKALSEIAIGPTPSAARAALMEVRKSLLLGAMFAGGSAGGTMPRAPAGIETLKTAEPANARAAIPTAKVEACERERRFEVGWLQSAALPVHWRRKEKRRHAMPRDNARRIVVMTMTMTNE
jgi:hypothetical protein